MKVYELIAELSILEAGAEITVVGDERHSRHLNLMGVDVDGHGTMADGYAITCYGATKGSENDGD